MKHRMFRRIFLLSFLVLLLSTVFIEFYITNIVRSHYLSELKKNLSAQASLIAENVPGILSPKFRGFVRKYIFDQLSDYSIAIFEIHAADYGVPQIRKRVFFVGFRNKIQFNKFNPPQPTHTWSHLGKKGLFHTRSLFDNRLAKTGGVRECLGLPNIRFDNLAPTVRSAFTGKRNTTSVLNSAAGQKAWGDMQIWPNGVQADRKKASAFPAKNGHFSPFQSISGS